MADNHDLVASHQEEKRPTKTLEQAIEEDGIGVDYDISGFKLLDYAVFPSEQKSILVNDTDGYGGAHQYAILHAKGFENGQAVPGIGLSVLQFVHKPGPDAETIEGLQSEQLAYVLIDRCQKLNARYPSPQNEKMLKALWEFIYACQERVEQRMGAGVMGKLANIPDGPSGRDGMSGITGEKPYEGTWTGTPSPQAADAIREQGLLSEQIKSVEWNKNSPVPQSPTPETETTSPSDAELAPAPDLPTAESADDTTNTSPESSESEPATDSTSESSSPATAPSKPSTRQSKSGQKS